MRTKRLLSLFDAFSLLSVLFLLAVVAVNIIARQIFDLSNGTINLMIPGAIELSRCPEWRKHKERHPAHL